jgi:uncharacterized Zn finger protein (UPF0148 family)
MTTFTQTRLTTFHVVSCYTCGCEFGINGEMYRRAVEDKIGSVICPSCGKHTQWVGKTREQKAREEAEQMQQQMQRKLDVANRRAERQAELAEKATRSLIATKGVVTRMKNRAANGVCPCCNRYFANVHRHMMTQHPEFLEEKPQVEI